MTAAARWKLRRHLKHFQSTNKTDLRKAVKMILGGQGHSESHCHWGSHCAGCLAFVRLEIPRSLGPETNETIHCRIGLPLCIVSMKAVSSNDGYLLQLGG